MQVGQEIFIVESRCGGDAWEISSGYVISEGLGKVFVHPSAYRCEITLWMVQTKNCFETKMAALLSIPSSIAYFHDLTLTALRPADICKLNGCQVLLETIKKEHKENAC